MPFLHSPCVHCTQQRQVDSVRGTLSQPTAGVCNERSIIVGGYHNDPLDDDNDENTRDSFRVPRNQGYSVFFVDHIQI